MFIYRNTFGEFRDAQALFGEHRASQDNVEFANKENQTNFEIIYLNQAAKGNDITAQLVTSL